MADLARYAGQGAVYALVAFGVGYLASRPSIEYFPPDRAQIKISFAHGANRIEECRRLSTEEIAKLPPSKRRPHTCGRERLPIRIQLLLDEVAIYDEVVQPTGLSSDGPARVYRKFQVEPGRHEITVRLRDSARTDGFDYERREDLELAPQQSLAVDFSGDQGTFIIR
ncbi:MAG: hypothetical protein KJZ80_01630 [Hyphomicrobiaceae bacterium]|nr:hypothetical protein [Hyphomicrobiaceae bacterium]